MLAELIALGRMSVDESRGENNVKKFGKFPSHHTGTIPPGFCFCSSVAARRFEGLYKAALAHMQLTGDGDPSLDAKRLNNHVTAMGLNGELSADRDLLTMASHANAGHIVPRPNVKRSRSVDAPQQRKRPRTAEPVQTGVAHLPFTSSTISVNGDPRVSGRQPCASRSQSMEGDSKTVAPPSIEKNSVDTASSTATASTSALSPADAAAASTACEPDAGCSGAALADRVRRSVRRLRQSQARQVSCVACGQASAVSRHCAPSTSAWHLGERESVERRVAAEHGGVARMAGRPLAGKSKAELADQLVDPENVKGLTALVRPDVAGAIVSGPSRGGATVSGASDTPSSSNLPNDTMSAAGTKLSVTGARRTLAATRGRLQRAIQSIDSEATESSDEDSMCEDELEDDIVRSAVVTPFVKSEHKVSRIPRHMQYSGAWHMERSWLGSRWMWLASAVSDLEYKIKQQMALHKTLRARKEPLTFGLPRTMDPVDAAECTCARTRPLLRAAGGDAAARRKLVAAAGMFAWSKRAGKAALARCWCAPPRAPCVSCAGRHGAVPRLDPCVQDVTKRLGLLDPSYHHALSDASSFSLSRRMHAVLAEISDLSTLEVQQQQEQRKNALRGAASGSTRHRSSKSLKKKEPGKVNMKRDSQGSSSLRASVPSATGKSAKGKGKPGKLSSGARRTTGNAYDMDNIIIDGSMFAPAKVEMIPYKEIETPRWREVDAPSASTSQSSSAFAESMDDGAFELRHGEYERLEQQRYVWYKAHARKAANAAADGAGGGQPDDANDVDAPAPDPTAGYGRAHLPDSLLPERLRSTAAAAAAAASSKRRASNSMLAAPATPQPLAAPCRPAERFLRTEPPFERRAFPLNIADQLALSLDKPISPDKVVIKR